MDPTVVAACDLAVNFVFGPTATYQPIGSAADTSSAREVKERQRWMHGLVVVCAQAGDTEERQHVKV